MDSDSDNDKKLENMSINDDMFADQKLELSAKQKTLCNKLNKNTQRRSQKFITMSHKHKSR